MNKKQKMIEAYFDNYSILMKMAISITRDTDKALDALQNLAIKILENDFSHVRNYPAYLKTSLRHGCIDLLRKEKKETSLQALEEFLQDKNFNDLNRVEVEHWLLSYLASFPPEMKNAFILHTIDGYTINDIAKQMGIKPATLRQRFKRMRDKLPVDVLLFVMMLRMTGACI